MKSKKKAAKKAAGKAVRKSAGKRTGKTTRKVAKKVVKKVARKAAKKAVKKAAKKATKPAVKRGISQAPGKPPKTKKRVVMKQSVAKKPAPAKPVAAAPRAAAPPLDPRKWRDAFLEIIRRTSAELPADVVHAIAEGRSRETVGSNALWAMDVIQENIALAADRSAPLCQDTGTIIFYIHKPQGADETALRRACEEAIILATEKGYLRQNSVDSLTGRNSGNNLGPGSPVIHFHQWDRPGLEVRLILKGGGCENVGAQYSLPDVKLGAGRDLAGVEKCVLDAAFQAQGKGCGPGILGVCIGGDRATGYEYSKEQLLRTIDDLNQNPELAALEERIVEKANQLGIGPMGFGGATTLLGCKIGVLNRLPASFFVSISYMCWAYRRQGAAVGAEGAIRHWLY